MITLRKVDKRNIWSIIRLKVHDEQQSFVATNTESILQAYTTITEGGVALDVYKRQPLGFARLSVTGLAPSPVGLSMPFS